MCNGAVFYGALSIDGFESPADFWGIQNNQWTVNDANKTGNVTCSPSTFEDTDPLPGEDKQCMCDETKRALNNIFIFVYVYVCVCVGYSACVMRPSVR